MPSADQGPAGPRTLDDVFGLVSLPPHRSRSEKQPRLLPYGGVGLPYPTAKSMTCTLDFRALPVRPFRRYYSVGVWCPGPKRGIVRT